MKALLGKKLSKNRVQCRLCSHFCVLSSDKRGQCGVRVCVESADGAELHTLVGGGVAAWHVDPVEKKPLYHYLPGSRTFSFGTMGCNFDCAWCQNDGISRLPAETGRVEGVPATPEGLVSAARAQGCSSLAFTYTEPTVFFELMTATADRARNVPGKSTTESAAQNAENSKPLGTILVSNGYQSPDCLDALRGRIQAANIDLKAFRETTYRAYCRASLQPVLDNLKRMKAFGWWLEVTTLVVPGINDDPHELRDIARFIRQELGPDTPWHISAFRPCRHMTDRGPTPLSSLTSAADVGQEEGLWFLYTGNVPPPLDRPTLCPHCRTVLVERRGVQARVKTGFAGTCPHCGQRVPGIWSKL